MKAPLALVVLLLVFSSSVSHAQYGPICGCIETEYYIYDGALVFNGSFEHHYLFSTNFQINLPGAENIEGWTIDGAGVVLTGQYWQASEGNQSVELNYLGSGGISQAITTIPGESYRLEFDLSGEPGMGDPVKGMQIYWDGSLLETVSFDTTGHSRSDMGWKHLSFDLPNPSTTSTQLRFVGSIPTIGNGGAAIDNVSVVAVPETYSLFLVTMVVIPAAIVARRKKSR